MNPHRIIRGFQKQVSRRIAQILLNMISRKYLGDLHCDAPWNQRNRPQNNQNARPQNIMQQVRIPERPDIRTERKHRLRNKKRDSSKSIETDQQSNPGRLWIRSASIHQNLRGNTTNNLRQSILEREKHRSVQTARNLSLRNSTNRVSKRTRKGSSWSRPIPHSPQRDLSPLSQRIWQDQAIQYDDREDLVGSSHDTKLEDMQYATRNGVEAYNREELDWTSPTFMSVPQRKPIFPASSKSTTLLSFPAKTSASEAELLVRSKSPQN